MTRFLLTNDDGVFADGLRQLAEGLAPLGEVVVVAPDREQSGVGHSISLHHPLRLREVEPHWYSVDGTPTDCVNLGLLSVLEEEPPDLLVSGINGGLNVGDDITYSGTVNAAFEGRLLGLPSIAVSVDVSEGADFRGAATFTRSLVESLLEEGLPEDLLLNVNLPAGDWSGVALTRLGRRVYHQVLVEKTDPRGRRYFWIGGEPVWDMAEGTDHEALAAGRISITPLHLDLTDYGRMNHYSGFVSRLDGAVKVRER